MNWDGRIRADARHLPIADGCVQCVVTSPPYWGLRDYGNDGQIGIESAPETYVASMVAVFREVWRVVKSDATVWLNLGDSYSAKPCSDGSDFHDGRSNRGKRHSGGLVASLKPKDLIGIPWRVAFALQADGWYLRRDIIWHKPNPMPESVTDRCTSSHEYIFMLTKSAKYFYDADAIREPAVTFNGFRGSSGDKSGANGDRNHGGRSGIASEFHGRNKRSVWTISSQPYPEAHYATFPEEIPEICIKAGSKPGDLILDPFFGSGTVGRVAERLSRRWIGCDLGYQDLQGKRMDNLQRELV